MYLVQDQASYHAAMKEIRQYSLVGFDTETTGLDPHTHSLRLLQFATEGGVYIVDTWRVPVWQPELSDLLNTATVVGHNLVFDLGFIARNGVRLPRSGKNLFDTMVARQILRAGLDIVDLGDNLDDAETGYKHRRNSLAATVKDHLGITLDKSQQVSNWARETLDPEQLEYAAKDAFILLDLHTELSRLLREGRLMRVMLLEMRSMPTLVKMRLAGMPVDVEEWKRLANDATRKLEVVKADLDAKAGAVVMPAKKSGRKAERVPGVRSINWASPAQVKHVFATRGYMLDTTNAATLKMLAAEDDVAAALVDYRYALKRATTYGHAWLENVNPITGRVHPTLNQVGAEQTGRMSSSKPNMQQIPNKPEDHGAYKSAFKAPPGRVLVKADYSQIELRVAAELAPCPAMLAAFDAGKDLHTLTAETVLGVPLDTLSPEERKAARQRGKVTNFGRLFGMGAKRFVDYAWAGFGMKITLEEAQRLGDAFFATFPGIRVWHRRQGEGPIEIRTLSGRRRQSVLKFTEMLNAPVQGTAADILKTALAIMHEREDRLPVYAGMVPIICVHDEIVVECNRSYAEDVKAWLVECMVDAHKVWLNRVPPGVDAQICGNWYGGD